MVGLVTPRVYILKESPPMKIEETFPPYDLPEIRLECLNRAVQTHGHCTSEEIIKAAGQYYRFVMNTSKDVLINNCKFN